LSPSSADRQGKHQPEGQECGNGEAREIHRSTGRTVYGRNRRKVGCIDLGRIPYPVNPIRFAAISASTIRVVKQRGLLLDPIQTSDSSQYT
jgi:hypothetical protein